MLSNISNEFIFTGPTSWNPTLTTDQLGFHGVAILKYGSQLTNSNLNQGYTNPIYPTDTPMYGLISIDFYLISYNPDSVFLPDKSYTHMSGIVGDFTVSYSTENVGFWNADFTPVTGTNGLPIPSQPYLGPGTITPDDPVPYVDPTDPIFDFTITDVQGSFVLRDAYDTGTAYVAKAQVIVTNADVSNPCGVTLTFTNQTNTEFFEMRNTEDSNLSTLEYKLFFNGTIIDPGDSVDWVGFVNTTYTKDIFVTQIQKHEVDTLVEGTYYDTIVVTLTPKDTV